MSECDWVLLGMSGYIYNVCLSLSVTGCVWLYIMCVYV